MKSIIGVLFLILAAGSLIDIKSAMAEEYSCTDADVRDQLPSTLLRYLAEKQGAKWEYYINTRQYHNALANIHFERIRGTPDRDILQDGWCSAIVVDDRFNGRSELSFRIHPNKGGVDLEVLQLVSGLD